VPAPYAPALPSAYLPNAIAGPRARYGDQSFAPARIRREVRRLRPGEHLHGAAAEPEDDEHDDEDEHHGADADVHD
jgi:hypothetical protein